LFTGILPAMNTDWCQRSLVKFTKTLLRVYSLLDWHRTHHYTLESASDTTPYNAQS